MNAFISTIGTVLFCCGIYLTPPDDRYTQLDAATKILVFLGFAGLFFGGVFLILWGIFSSYDDKKELKKKRELLAGKDSKL